MTELRKFGFDAVFDAEGDVVVNTPPRKAFFSAAEVEQARAEAAAEGRRAALHSSEQMMAASLGDISRQIAQAMTALAKLAHDHRVASAELALAAARKIADAALERFPDAAAKAALEALSREIESYPRLLVRASEAAAAQIQQTLDRAAEAAGYAGQVTVRADPTLAGAAFIFEWGEGRAAFDPQQAAQRVAEALDAALAAEGLHGEPLDLTQGASNG
jgi:flagellar assembly protein FliH